MEISTLGVCVFFVLLNNNFLGTVLNSAFFFFAEYLSFTMRSRKYIHHTFRSSKPHRNQPPPVTSLLLFNLYGLREHVEILYGCYEYMICL